MHTDLSFISNAHGKEQLIVKNVVWRKKMYENVLNASQKNSV